MHFARTSNEGVDAGIGSSYIINITNKQNAILFYICSLCGVDERMDDEERCHEHVKSHRHCTAYLVSWKSDACMPRLPSVTSVRFHSTAANYPVISLIGYLYPVILCSKHGMCMSVFNFYDLEAQKL